jgi:hypothetical protein
MLEPEESTASHPQVSARFHRVPLFAPSLAALSELAASTCQACAIPRRCRMAVNLSALIAANHWNGLLSVRKGASERDEGKNQCGFSHDFASWPAIAEPQAALFRASLSAFMRRDASATDSGTGSTYVDA